MLSNQHQRQQLIEFFESSTKLHYKKGDIIIRPEDPPSGIFFIEKGHVKAYSITKYGEENLLLVRKNPDVFPLIWAFTGQHREITYEAMDECVLRRCSKVNYLALLEKNPEILPFVVDMAVEAYRLHSERVNTLSYRTVRERVMSFLLSCIERFGSKTPQGILINAPLRQQDIASSINATRESTSRELSAMAKKGIIAFNSDHAIIVKNSKALEDAL